MADWSFAGRKGACENWPLTDSGEPETPAFLMHVAGNQLDCDMAINMLEAYGIPSICEYPNDGTFGKIILGFAGSGLDLYVPESMLTDARNIISTDAEQEQGE